MFSDMVEFIFGAGFIPEDLSSLIIVADAVIGIMFFTVIVRLITGYHDYNVELISEQLKVTKTLSEQYTDFIEQENENLIVEIKDKLTAIKYSVDKAEKNIEYLDLLDNDRVSFVNTVNEYLPALIDKYLKIPVELRGEPTGEFNTRESINSNTPYSDLMARLDALIIKIDMIANRVGKAAIGDFNIERNFLQNRFQIKDEWLVEPAPFKSELNKYR
jgi:mitochondrial fission protein ELM1